MKTAKQIVEELEAEEKLAARGWKKVQLPPCCLCGGEGGPGCPYCKGDKTPKFEWKPPEPPTGKLIPIRDDSYL